MEASRPGIDHDNKGDVFQRLANGLAGRPPGKLLGRRVDIGDSPAQVDGDHGVGDAVQGDRETLAGFLRLTACTRDLDGTTNHLFQAFRTDEVLRQKVAGSRLHERSSHERIGMAGQHHDRYIESALADSSQHIKAGISG